VNKCCPLRPATYINAQNAQSFEREFSQFTKRVQYLTETKNTQQATGNAAETLFYSRFFYILLESFTSKGFSIHEMQLFCISCLFSLRRYITKHLISAVLLGKSLFCFSNENSMNLNVSLHCVSEENRKVLNHSSSGWVEGGGPRHQPLSVPDVLVIII
jgi:flagellar biosynthesis regulator FlaF